MKSIVLAIKAHSKPTRPAVGRGSLVGAIKVAIRRLHSRSKRPELLIIPNLNQVIKVLYSGRYAHSRHTGFLQTLEKLFGCTVLINPAVHDLAVYLLPSGNWLSFPKSDISVSVDSMNAQNSQLLEKFALEDENAWPDSYCVRATVHVTALRRFLLLDPKSVCVIPLKIDEFGYARNPKDKVFHLGTCDLLSLECERSVRLESFLGEAAEACDKCNPYGD